MWKIYLRFVKDKPILSSFIQVMILGTIGEILSAQIAGTEKGFPFTTFQIMLKMIVWGILGISFKYAFIGFTGFISNLCENNLLPGIFYQPGNIFNALAISIVTNALFGPIMMLFHRWLDIIIMNQPMNWPSMIKAWWTLVYFWIIAHTITFSQKKHLQVGLAAVWAVILGVILGFFARMK